MVEVEGMTKPRFAYICLILVQPLLAVVTPAPLFQNGAVLQRDMPVPVWGKAPAGSKVTVAFAGQSESATADAHGRWLVTLQPLQTSAEGRAMTIAGDAPPAIEITGVRVGEVWLASGQSNMQWRVSQSTKQNQETIKAGGLPLLSSFDLPHRLSHRRMDTVGGKWRAATEETIPSFSAVGFFFARKLVEELGVPVGIIHGSWGGARIEPWWAEEGLDGIPELEALRKTRLASSPGFPAYDRAFRKHVDELAAWTKVAAQALDAGHPAPDMPTAPPLLNLGHKEAAGTYQAMIHPLVPYALRGFIWYQGESNNGEGLLYTAKMRALINGWRQQFKSPQAPFLFVQLAPFQYGGESGKSELLPGIWWAQQEVLKIPHTGMVVTNDIGDIKDIHPANKLDVGERLALWALADTYGREGLVKSGPLFSGYEVAGGTIIVRFDHTGSGLASRDGKPLDCFEVAGADGDYHPADARIADDGASIVLSSANVPAPVRARFAWSHIAEPNLMNKEGLPAGAFLTHPGEIAKSGR
jgi:sialate O-acetylesterase